MDEVTDSTAKPMRYNLRSSVAAKRKNEMAQDQNSLNTENDANVVKKMRYNLRSLSGMRGRAANTAAMELPKSATVSKPVPESPIESLMLLDDYCLLEIFDHLKVKDLSNIAYVNKRLNALARTYFQSKYKIPFAANFKSTSCMAPINLEVIQAFLCIFGKDITALTLSRDSFDHTYNDFTSMAKILSYIQTYCTNVKEFTLIGFGTCGLHQKFFARLKALTLIKCSVSRDWCNMIQLEKLKLEEVIFRRWPKSSGIPVNCFGRLKSARLTDVNIGNDQLKKFINSNQGLKVLSVVKCLETSSNAFDAVKNLSELKELEFKKNSPTHFPIDVSPLTTLKKLKVLQFAYKNYNASKFFAGLTENGVAVEHLELGFGEFNDTAILGLAKLQTIKILHFNEMNGLNEAHIVNIANDLKLLEELQIKTTTIISQNGIKEFVRAAKRLTCLKVEATGFTLDIETYQAILTAIKERENQSTLELTIYGQKSVVPNEIMNAQNEKWLSVRVDRHDMFDDLKSKVGHAPPRYNYYSSDD